MFLFWALHWHINVFFRQIMTLHSVCFILQNIFHFLCERNNGQVPLPAANTVSCCILSPVSWCFSNAVHAKDIRLLFLSFDLLTFVAERRSLENILPRTCSWDSEWVCHSIWDWKYLPSNDVSKNSFLCWVVNKWSAVNPRQNKGPRAWKKVLCHIFYYYWSEKLIFLIYKDFVI